MATPIAGDPLTAGLTSFASGLASGLTGGSSSAGQRSDVPFDSSGWIVNFGNGDISTQRSQAGELSQYMPYLVLASGLLIVWRLTRKSSK